jgi:hypothetical protein
MDVYCVARKFARCLCAFFRAPLHGVRQEAEGQILGSKATMTRHENEPLAGRINWQRCTLDASNDILGAVNTSSTCIRGTKGIKSRF